MLRRLVSSNPVEFKKSTAQTSADAAATPDPYPPAEDERQEPTIAPAGDNGARTEPQPVPPAAPQPWRRRDRLSLPSRPFHALQRTSLRIHKLRHKRIRRPLHQIFQ